MKDAKFVVLCILIGIAVAFAVSGPLRRPAGQEPRVGTPLSGGSTVATQNSPASGVAPKIYAEGIIRLDPAVAQSVTRSSVLFIIARPPGSPPVAVKRLAPTSFPVSFSLTEQDSMMAQGFVDVPLTVIARLDYDGQAGPKQPEDFEGSAAVKAGGSRQVDITITK